MKRLIELVLVAGVVFWGGVSAYGVPVTTLNVTPLDLSTADLGSQIVAPLNTPFVMMFDDDYDGIPETLDLEGVLTTEVYWDADSQIATFVYGVSLIDGIGYLDCLHVSPFAPADGVSYVDSGYDSSGSVIATDILLTPVNNYVIDFRFPAWGFYAGMAPAAVWIQVALDGPPSLDIGLCDITGYGGEEAFDAYVPVPEPATMLLLVGSIGSVLALRKRRA